MGKERARCRSCGLKFANRPGVLCWTCYYTPGVAQRFPPGSKFARRGPLRENVVPAQPASPTSAPPGTEDKIREMERRVARGEAVFHPGDAMDYEGST